MLLTYEGDVQVSREKVTVRIGGEMISCAAMYRTLHIFLQFHSPSDNFLSLSSVFSRHDHGLEHSRPKTQTFYPNRGIGKKPRQVRRFVENSPRYARNVRSRRVHESIGAKSNGETRSIRAVRLLPTNCHMSSLKSRCTKGVSPSVSSAYPCVCAKYYLRGCQRVHIIRTWCRIRVGALSSIVRFFQRFLCHCYPR